MLEYNDINQKGWLPLRCSLEFQSEKIALLLHLLAVRTSPRTACTHSHTMQLHAQTAYIKTNMIEIGRGLMDRFDLANDFCGRHFFHALSCKP